mmetsp:Transcript_22563/g.31416  ORF Transcript_22563/g.31416 Transcript_22563/m.31416 type:complete len:285 (-) Transcript_22563:182-1036(-)|eukprot:CAMPEP_0196582528 /NCGR_PEP_ID=MMETSP1081-20130531/39335_1 /TAXON_ID=36882 /ORGANISM="Pyramimonas amylifera, Strain CCMP720" /LENGTH=284 /DNA_ID=CAMNT_0041903123 /DNA_START=114 /DNA_END=968 /DNA_ORIENTATION=-
MNESSTPFRNEEVSIEDSDTPKEFYQFSPMTEPVLSSLGPLESAELYSLTRGAVKDKVREICQDESTSLLNNIRSEVSSFEQRLAESSQSPGPQVEAPQMQEFLESLSGSIHQHSEHLEAKLEGMLDHVSVCLQEELSREQEHLMLMQHKLDSQSQTLQKVTADLTKKLDVEKSARMLMQHNIRENKDALQSQISNQQSQIDDLNKRPEQNNRGLGSGIPNLCGQFRKCFMSCWPSEKESQYSTLLMDDLSCTESSDYRPLTNVVDQTFSSDEIDSHSQELFLS